jgi:hypothetical protein
MTYRQLSFTGLILSLIICSGVAVAQQVSLPGDKSSTANAPLRQKAIDLLKSLAGETSALQSAENRARMRSNIAGSLWTHDEKTARRLIASVETDIQAELQSWQTERKDHDRLKVFLNLRMDTVERIAKHDAELALAFLKATDPGSDDRLPYGVLEAQDAFELRLAKEIAGSNPEVALKLGRESLSRGFSDELLSVLRRLQKKDRERGLILYREIVGKIRDVDFSQNWQAMNFAQILAKSFKPPHVDEPTFRELINVFITSALLNCGNRNTTDDTASFCWQIGSLMPLMENVDPSRAAPLKKWAAPNDEREPSAEAYAELADIFAHGTVDEVLELTSKHPQIDFEIRWHAMRKAQEAGNVERAREIATRYEGDPEKQRRMLTYLDESQRSTTMDDEKLSEIQRRLHKIPGSLQRVGFLLSVADRIGPNNPQAALPLLNQASEIVDTMKPGKEQAEAQIGLAIMYCQKKSDRGFAIMESLVPKLNDLVGAAVKLDGYDNRYLRDSEWNMTGEGGIGSLLTSLAHDAGYFAWRDFDRSVNLAAQFERPEIRMMAQLKLAQAILTGSPKQSRNAAVGGWVERVFH